MERIEENKAWVKEFWETHDVITTPTFEFISWVREKQEAIDEDHLREVTKMLIDKACKAHCGICDFFACCPYEFEGCPERNEVRKAMMEE